MKVRTISVIGLLVVLCILCFILWDFTRVAGKRVKISNTKGSVFVANGLLKGISDAEMEVKPMKVMS